MWSRSTFVLLLGVVMMACSTVLPKAPPMSREPERHDGDYGVSLSYDHPSGTCLGSRIETRFWVRNGKLGGYANHPIVGTFVINGKVLPDGQLVNATAVGPRNVTFEGTIDSGTWSSDSGRDCRGAYITALQGRTSTQTRVATAALRDAKTPGSATESIPIAISWQGIEDVLLGELSFSDQDDGGAIEVRGSRIFCHGQWKWAQGREGDGGSWTVSCSNGKVASGTFSYRGQRQGTGQGVDTALNEVKVTFGR